MPSNQLKKCWRTRDIDGDIWSEDAIVFDKDTPIETVFTNENMFILFDSYSKDEYAVEITIEKNVVTVSFSLHGNVDDEDNDPDIFKFYAMSQALVV